MGRRGDSPRHHEWIYPFEGQIFKWLCRSTYLFKHGMMVSTKFKHWMSVESVSERAWVKEEGVSLSRL
jgi:hypothetical protein